MPMFRKKPVTIEARQFPDSMISPEAAAAANDLAAWCGGEAIDDAVDGPCILIRTLGCTVKAKPGDWIIRGVKGEFYPCKPDIFAATYDPAPDWAHHGYEPLKATTDNDDLARAFLDVAKEMQGAQIARLQKILPEAVDVAIKYLRSKGSDVTATVEEVVAKVTEALPNA